MIKNSDFTNDTRNELLSIVKNQENAFDLLIKNLKYKGDSKIDTTKIVTRLQTQYIAENRKEGDLRTVEDWDQKEYDEPNEVNQNIPNVVKDKYSSFALLKVDDFTELTFPLLEDYSSVYEPFYTDNFSDVSFATNIRNIADKLGIEIKQNDYFKESVYKQSVLKNAIIKIKNKVLKLLKKPVKIIGIFNGKISLKTKIGKYNFSNVEKITKINDFLLGVAIKQEAKSFVEQMGSRAKEMKYVARLFADVLMARVTDLGDINNNKKLEKCLWLQFANAINKFNFDSNQLRIITKLGLQATVYTCKSLDITKERIVERMNTLGYNYACIPGDEFEAFTEVKQKDYSVYAQALTEKTEENANDQTKTRTNDVTFNFIDKRIVQQPEQVDEKIVQQTNLSAEENNVEQQKLNENQFTKVKREITLKQKVNKEINQVQEEKAEFEQKTNLEQEQHLDLKQELVESKKELTINSEQKQVKKTTIEKIIDKAVIKFLADQGTKIAEKINMKKVKGKKLQFAQLELNLYNLMLSYYVQATHSRPMSVKNDGKYNQNDISIAKIIVKALIHKRKNVVEAIFNCDVKKLESQTSTSYINSICKSFCNESVRDYFIKIIKKSVNYCVGEQLNKDSQNNIDDEKFDDLMEASEKYLNSIVLDDKTGYVPNFVMVDINEKQKDEYKPNFILINEREEQTK